MFPMHHKMGKSSVVIHKVKANGTIIVLKAGTLWFITVPLFRYIDEIRCITSHLFVRLTPFHAAFLNNIFCK